MQSTTGQIPGSADASCVSFPLDLWFAVAPGWGVGGERGGDSGLASQPVTMARSRVKEPNAGKDGPLTWVLLAK